MEREKCKIGLNIYWIELHKLFRVRTARLYKLFVTFRCFIAKRCFFFQDVLFPYVKENVEAFLKENFSEDGVKAVVAQLREQAIEDVKSEVDGAVAIADEVIIADLF